MLLQTGLQKTAASGLQVLQAILPALTCHIAAGSALQGHAICKQQRQQQEQEQEQDGQQRQCLWRPSNASNWRRGPCKQPSAVRAMSSASNDTEHVPSHSRPSYIDHIPAPWAVLDAPWHPHTRKEWDSDSDSNSDSDSDDDSTHVVGAGGAVVGGPAFPRWASDSDTDGVTNAQQAVLEHNKKCSWALIRAFADQQIRQRQQQQQQEQEMVTRPTEIGTLLQHAEEQLLGWQQDGQQQQRQQQQRQQQQQQQPKQRADTRALIARTSCLCALVPGLGVTVLHGWHSGLSDKQLQQLQTADLAPMGQLLLALHDAMPTTDVAGMVAGCPSLLLEASAAEVAGVVALMQQELLPGMAPADVEALIAKHPTVLMATAGQLRGSFSALTAAVGADFDVAKMVAAWPPLLLLAARPGAVQGIVEDVEAARQLLGRATHDYFVQSCPHMLSAYKGGGAAVRALRRVAALLHSGHSRVAMMQVLTTDPSLFLEAPWTAGSS